jgi:hypothetical protein
MSIYVEILVRAPMDALWSHTQMPALHERWDLRFSTIEYLPPSSDTVPQRFRYTTRLGFGLEVSGYGETRGQRGGPDGSATSALKFGSDNPLSIIREGSGYWKYVPTKDGVWFLTRYDYRTRFGAAGALFDRVIFRPLIGCATAWSFDRLRLWLEERLDPAAAVRRLLIHVCVRITLVLVLAYVGIVTSGWPGTCELGAAGALLTAWPRRWTAGIPSAGRCLRQPHVEQS